MTVNNINNGSNINATSAAQKNKNTSSVNQINKDPIKNSTESNNNLSAKTLSAGNSDILDISKEAELASKSSTSNNKELSNDNNKNVNENNVVDGNDKKGPLGYIISKIKGLFS